jgi:hypothetical protein
VSQTLREFEVKITAARDEVFLKEILVYARTAKA